MNFTKIHNRRKTHCIHGHALTPENCYIARDGHRACKECYKSYPSVVRKRAARIAHSHQLD